MKKLLLLLFIPFLLGAGAQDSGWLTRSNCLTLGNPAQFGTVCLNTSTGILSQGHQYTYQGGSPGSAGSWLDTTGGGTGGGSVNIFSSGNLSPLFTTSVATPTTTPALSFSLSAVSANTVFGNATGSSAAPSFGQLVTGQITNNAVTLAKLQNAIGSAKLLGSGATGAGTPYAEITLGTGLSMSGTTLNASGGSGGISQITGDVTAGPGSGSVVGTIPNGTVTFAKMQTSSANSVLVGSGTTGGGSPFSNISLGSGLVMSGTTLSVNGTMTGTGTTGTIPVFTGLSAIGNSIMTQPDVNTIALGSGNTGIFSMGSILLNGTTSGTISILPQAAAGTYNFNLPTTAGTAGQCLISGGGGSAANTWGTCGTGGGGGAFSAITTGTNTTATMTVGSGGTINRSGTGVIDASLVAGKPVANIWTGQTTDPTGSNNTAGGYTTGDMWLNTTASPNKAWVKTDETAGVATWIQASSAPAANSYRTCAIVIPGSGTGGLLQAADMGPTLDGNDCLVTATTGTVVEVTVTADTDTPNIIVGRNRAGSVVNLVSSALASGSSGSYACSRATAVACFLSSVTASATLQNTSVQAGDFFSVVSGGISGGTAHRISVHITWTVNS